MKKLSENKSGVSAVIATLFLVMITVAAVAIIWGMVIPFIKGNLNLDQRQVDLRIVTEGGYTVYDKEKGIAFVNVARGNDNETLAGMQLLIDFDGTTYSVTENEPNPGSQKSYFFIMTDMRDKGYLPGTVSVAPVFILDARQVLGEITSSVRMPILNIIKNYTEILLELTPEQITEMANITEENKTMDLVTYCPNTGSVGRDPWGGCPIAAGDIYSVHTEGSYSYFDFNETTGSWNNKKIKFKGNGCVLKNNSCVTIVATMNDESWWTNSFGEDAGIISLSDKSVLNQTTQKCVGNNWFYVYDSVDCL